MDGLAPFFANFELSARVFYSGRLCGISGSHESERAGHLHVLRSGKLNLIEPNGKTLRIEQPSVLFFPRPYLHRFRADRKNGAELVCATVEFGAGLRNPLVLALPEVLVVPLDAVPELAPTVALLFAEAFGHRPGRQTAVDRLTEYFLVLLLRSAMKARLIEGGILMGLADPRLARAISAIHAHPEREWSLKELAAAAGMSRARFAVLFRKIVGMTPFAYLTDWRIGLAQTLLHQGKALKFIAPAIGFSGSTALTRAFTHRVGLTPTQWRSRERQLAGDQVNNSHR
jgi:AraC-like DNA-binding protein